MINRSLGIFKLLAFSNVILIAMVPASVSWGQTPTAPRPRNEYEYTMLQLRGDGEAFRAAVERVRAMVDAGVEVNGQWLTALAEKGHFTDVAALAMKGITNFPENPDGVAGLWRLRVEALMDEGNDPAAALAAAKAYYNVAPLKETEAAVRLVSRGLDAAYPDDASLLRRFKTQQVQWSTVDVLPATGSGELGENVLKTIKITDDALGKLADANKRRDFAGLMAKGNLLLLADRCAEARKAFESAELAAENPEQASAAVEGVARAIRAEAGALGPANAYIVAQQGGK